MKGESMEGVTFPGIPTPFHWLAGPAVAFAVGVGELTLEAGPGTDWFVDPSGESDATVNSPALVGSIDGDLMLRAFVRPEFVETYDAGVLVLWGDERTWAKLCFEYSPQGVPTVVSVVTRGVSDDCNSISVDGEGIWLRISRLGEAFAFHASIDGSTWQLIRYFALPSTQPLAVGFQAQSPLGAGCTVRFSRVELMPERLSDLRSGV